MSYHCVASMKIYTEYILSVWISQVSAVLQSLECGNSSELQAEDKKYLHPERVQLQLDDDKVQELFIWINYRPGIQTWLRDEGIISWPANLKNIFTILLPPQRSGYPFLIEKNPECN